MGDVLESYQIIDLYTFEGRIRDNVYWHDIPPVNGRKFTVEDIQFSFERGQEDPRNVYYTQEVRDPEIPPFFEKIDDRTFRINYEEPTTRVLHGVMNWMYMVPHEVWEEAGDFNNPNYQIGIGPFILDNIVTDARLEWVRNPNYHHFDPAFPANRLPYVDAFEALVIPDQSTRLAALRTGVIDYDGSVPFDKVDSMLNDRPDLMWRSVPPDASNTMWPRNDLLPFSIKEVRQAISIAINQREIAEDYYDDKAYILTWPVMPSFVDHYTPLEELPESSRILYEHHPDIARQMLADAGYPDGFNTSVQVSSANTYGIDVMSLVQGYLAEVDINMEIEIVEPTTFGNILWVRQFPGLSYISWGNNGIDDAFGWAHGGWVSDAGVGSVYAFSNVVDPVAQETYEYLITVLDLEEQSQIRREECLREIDLCWEIPIPTPAQFVFWQPWIKGYSGEVGVGPDPVENTGVFRYVWVDQDLKYELIGERD
jgi:peptide/nickel transport system substrate-binding protein